MLIASPVLGISEPGYDLREEIGRQAIEPSRAQLEEFLAIQAIYPDLAATYDTYSGATRTLYNMTGFVTEPGGTETALERAFDYAEANTLLLGLEPADLFGLELTDEVFSAVDGVTHVYFRQRYADIPVYNGQLHVNVTADNRILSVNNSFVPDLAGSANAEYPVLVAAVALVLAAAEIDLEPDLPPVVDPTSLEPGVTLLNAPGISSEPVAARLMWLPIQRGQTRLVWNFLIYTPDGVHAYDINVDAETGVTWTRFDMVKSASYRGYERPTESPSHSSPAAPADGRVVINDPQAAAPIPSPHGWHSTGSQSWTIHRGNNVHAYDDRAGRNVPPTSEPNCGAGLNCSFAINLNGQPSAYTSASVTNAFYWLNLAHDIQYLYGFDEKAGNFQVKNFGRGGKAADALIVEVQDPHDTNNGAFYPRADGQPSKIEFFEWDHTNPRRDSALDNLVVVHEFGHGVSLRQVGGPSNVSCLENTQSPGEGWSDWLGLVYTAKTTDVGTAARGVGTYLRGQTPAGGGERAEKYSTNESVNSWRYSDFSVYRNQVHNRSAIWAQGLWEVYWALVGAHGAGDLHEPPQGSQARGNHRAMRYVNQGMKNTPCSPTFLDARDGIVQAAQAAYSGTDVCRLWQSFASYGMGTNAETLGPNHAYPTDGFAVPSGCAFSVVIDGPENLNTGEVGVFQAIVTNAPGPKSYQWYWRRLATSAWLIGPTTMTFSRSFTDNSEVRVDVTSAGQTVSARRPVFVN